MMETSESLEEGLIPNPPLLEPTPMITNEIGNGGGMSESDFSTTPAVVFSTLVAICGSFTYGCAVRSIAVFFAVRASQYIFLARLISKCLKIGGFQEQF
ncbi:hypothetical protein CISIN_1g040289mg [Citrus sinensis]|uniref:Uncharacterized protein n=1 Tax=Citrus sinensis TaxID=2711 RepID=A0A067E295_CITSI|nr:hypothetical protein CISIN_1g040289mg [Citrus sinensis]